MKMHTRAADQGQMVEVSYGWSGGVLYQRCHDRSSGRTTWYRATTKDCQRLADSSLLASDDAVNVRKWIHCDEPRVIDEE